MATPTDFSVCLQHGITGGFAPPTPSAVLTVTGEASWPHLNITTAVRPLGTPSLQNSPPKTLAISDEVKEAIRELHNILKELPTESPPGSEDIYGLDTGIFFQSGNFEWINGGPAGCGGGVSSVQATDDQKTQFKRAVDIIEKLTEHKREV